MIQIKVNGNFKKLRKKLQRINRDFESSSFLEDIAKLVNSSIQRRVQQSGEGTDGSKMESYSSSYSALKAASGRNVRFRDLTFKGNMWQSLTTTKVPNGARMFFWKCCRV